MRILEQTRQVVILRFGDAVLPLLASSAALIAGLGAFVAGAAVGNFLVGAVGALLMLAGGLFLLREQHVTLTVDRSTLTIHVRRWKYMMPSEVTYRKSDLVSLDVHCGRQRTPLAEVIPSWRTRCMLVANFPTGPDMILVRGMKPNEAREAHRLILMYLE